MPRAPRAGKAKTLDRNLRVRRERAPRHVPVASMPARRRDPAVPRPPEGRAAADAGHPGGLRPRPGLVRALRRNGAVSRRWRRCGAIDLLEYLAELTEQAVSALAGPAADPPCASCSTSSSTSASWRPTPPKTSTCPASGGSCPAFLTLAEVDALLAAPDRRTDRGAPRRRHARAAVRHRPARLGAGAAAAARDQLPGRLPGRARQGPQGAAGADGRGGAAIAALLRRERARPRLLRRVGAGGCRTRSS